MYVLVTPGQAKPDACAKAPGQLSTNSSPSGAIRTGLVAPGMAMFGKDREYARAREGGKRSFNLIRTQA